MTLSDISRPADQLRFAISDLELYRTRILEAVQTRRIRNAQGGTQILDENTGIDILGNMIEASILSPDQTFYGDLHNLGHIALSYIHDPDHRYLVIVAQFIYKLKSYHIV